MCGPVRGSLQFRAVARQCSPPFAYESGSEERTEVPERVRSGHDTGTNNRSQLCKSRCSCTMSWQKKSRREREGEREWTPVRFTRWIQSHPWGTKDRGRIRKVREWAEGYVTECDWYRLSTIAMCHCASVPGPIST